ncbi:MAG: outer membrane beta-barrel protein [Ketobacteraceae bacterium]|nr:outer membrane beta-barrel protein [Ketobacteraceae bacterium]
MFMVRVKLALLLALGSFVSSNVGAVDLDGVYLGGGTQTSIAELQYGDWLADDDEYGTGGGFNLFAGYRIVDNIALELEGRYWGIGADGTSSHEGDLRGNVSAGFKFSIPVSRWLDLNASFGLTHWFIKDYDREEGRDNGIIGFPGQLETHDSGAYYGLGASGYVNNALELGFRYEMHSAFVTQVESYNFYAAYHFGEIRRSAPHSIFSRLYVSFNAAQFSRGGYAENVGIGSFLSVSDDVAFYLQQIPSYEGDYVYGGGGDTDGYYFFVGYQMNPWVSLEIGAMDFGDYELNLGTLRDANGVEYVINEPLVDASMTGTLFGFRALAYRASFGLNIYTRFGVNHVEADIDRSYLSLEFDEGVSSTFTAPYYGAGIGYQVSDSIGISLDYIVFELDDAVVNARSRSIGLGISVAFGGESRGATNVRESSVFTDYATEDDKPAPHSMDRTTACDERYRRLFFACDNDEQGNNGN